MFNVSSSVGAQLREDVDATRR